MRQSALAAATTAAVFGALVSSSAVAMTRASSTLGPAVETIDPIERADCWRFGRHGWGWYRWCGPRHEVWEHEVWEPGCREVTIREHRFGETEVRHIRRCD